MVVSVFLGRLDYLPSDCELLSLRWDGLRLDSLGWDSLPWGSRTGPER